MLNKGRKPAVSNNSIKSEPIELSDDIEILKEELRKAKLKIELQDLIIDVASKELGIDIRKKSGTKQSK